MIYELSRKNKTEIILLHIISHDQMWILRNLNHIRIQKTSLPI